MNATIARLSVRSLFGQKRGILLAVLPLLLIVLSGVTAALVDGSSAVDPVTVVFGVSLVLPLVALLVSNGVLGPEIDDGSIVYLLSKPVSRYTVVLSKYVVAAGVGLVFGAGSVLVSALILDPAQVGQAAALGVGAAAAVLAYSGLFLALAAITRHGTIAGLIYILLLEGLLTPWLSGLQYVSVGALSRRLAGELDDGLTLLLRDMSLTYTVVALAVLAVGGVLVGGHRLRSFQLIGEE